MLQKCAWCGKHLGHVGFEDDTRISHGICPECSNSLLTCSTYDLRCLLDKLPGPIFLVNKNFKVVTINSNTEKMLTKGHLEFEGFFGGQVIDCIHSFEPGGCGNTAHCAGCVIRNSVVKTLQTGVGCSEKPAFQYLKKPEGCIKVGFLITTEKVGDNSVVLQIQTV